MSSAVLACARLVRPDIVVATSPHFFCACAGLLVSKVMRRPWVFELRDLWPESIAALGAVRSTRALDILRALELYLYGDAAAIVALTCAFRDTLITRHGVPGAKVRVVTNGVDLDEWAQIDRTHARNVLGVDSMFVVSYVGTHGMAHKLETLLEAANLLRGDATVRFVMVGDGAERERLLCMKEEMGLRNVTMQGQVDRDRARLYVAASDVCVIPLRKAEVFRTVIPSKVFEAMAARVPIVLGVEGEAKRIVEESRAGLCVEPENARGFADAILRLKTDERLRRSLGENGCAAVRARFDRRVLAAKMLDVMEQTVSGQGRR